ncbi:MAG TPA: polysaccharide biosynthesis C-terminal domain-containing protein [Mycobacteriales bacterium]|nr:polysaccharide biosynthesis C-terminal domain-containing protein [Mycobacteriales bacterium]
MVVQSLGARGLTVVLGAIAGVVIARVLAPEGRGAYAVVVAVATTAIALGHLSLETAQISLWKRADLRSALAANALVLSVVLGAVVGIAAYGLVQLLGDERVPVYSDLGLLLGLAAIPVSLLALWTNSLLSLSSRVDRLNLGLVLSAVFQTAMLLALAAAGRLTVTAVVVVWAATSALPLAVSLPTLRPRLSEVSGRVLRLQITRGLRYHAGVALLFLLFRVDVLILNAYRPTEDVGLYALAVTLAELVYLLSDAIAQAIASRQAEGGTAAGSITTLAIRMSACGAVVLCFGLLLTAPWAVPLVYGAAFAGTVVPLLVLLPGVLALAIGRPVAILLAARDRPGVSAGLSAGAFAVHLVLALVLIPRYGPVGAAASSTAAYVALCIGYLAVARRLAPARWGDFVPRGAEVRSMLHR